MSVTLCKTCVNPDTRPNVYLDDDGICGVCKNFKKDKEGNFFYIGRLKDSVRVRGENISAWEIETTLNKLSYISESAVLKVKAEIGEYEILALIISKNNNFTINKIVNKCKNNFSKNYLPRYWCLTKDFPRTPTLRVDKKKIKIKDYQFFDRVKNNFINFIRFNWKIVNINIFF